jgi:hypothetical protein
MSKKALYKSLIGPVYKYCNHFTIFKTRFHLPFFILMMHILFRVFVLLGSNNLVLSNPHSLLPEFYDSFKNFFRNAALNATILDPINSTNVYETISYPYESSYQSSHQIPNVQITQQNFKRSYFPLNFGDFPGYQVAAPVDSSGQAIPTVMNPSFMSTGYYGIPPSVSPSVAYDGYYSGYPYKYFANSYATPSGYSYNGDYGYYGIPMLAYNGHLFSNEFSMLKDNSGDVLIENSSNGNFYYMNHELDKAPESINATINSTEALNSTSIDSLADSTISLNATDV